MEITSFYPLIATTDYEGTKAAYEALGFKQAHDISLLADVPAHIIIMKNDKGFRLGIVYGFDFKGSLPSTVTWMNVRDFEGAVASLKEHGFTDFTSEHDYEFMKIHAMKAPDGHVLIVVYHKRKDDWD